MLSVATVTASDLSDINNFVQVCRDLAERRGKRVADSIGGGREFHDGGLRVHEKQDLSMVITYYYGDTKGNPTLNNPVIMVSPEGKIYRAHMEWRLGIPRVSEYLESGFEKVLQGLMPHPTYYDMV